MRLLDLPGPESQVSEKGSGHQSIYCAMLNGHIFNFLETESKRNRKSMHCFRENKKNAIKNVTFGPQFFQIFVFVFAYF